MAKQIYRKALLERMSSPEQLDKMIVITSPAFWLALLGGAVIVAVALVWSVFGRLPIHLEVSGILVPDQGAYTLAADTGGIVSTVEVKNGDHVEVGDVLLTLVDADVQAELDLLYDRYAKVEAVTPDSIGDIVSQDNQELINIKTQMAATGMEGEQQEAILSMYQADLAELSSRVAAAKTAMEQARAEYYSHMGSTTNSGIELGYSEAQAAYNQHSSLYSNYSGNTDAAKANYSQTLGHVLETLRGNVTHYIENFEILSAASDAEPKEVMVGTAVYTRETLTALQTALEGITNDTAPSGLGNDILMFLHQIDSSQSAYTQLEQLWDQYEVALSVSSKAEEAYQNAYNHYQNTKSAYESYVNRNAGQNAEKERLGNIYNERNNEWSSLYSQEQQLRQQIVSIEGQIKAAGISDEVRKEGYLQQFEATQSALLANLQAEIDKYEYNLEKTRIKSTASGTVSDIKVNAGAALAQGSDVVTIRQLSEENLIICYVPINSGKKVQEGMTAIIKPTTINDQEYGHMEAEVITVDEYVATSSSMRTILGDDTLVQAFVQNGPVVGITCRLRTDETTVSGYWWSSRKGSDLIVPEGTMVTADIVTEEKVPITMLIPYVKEKLFKAVEPEVGGKEGQ